MVTNVVIDFNLSFGLIFQIHKTHNFSDEYF
jgi:hypothetical protein